MEALFGDSGAAICRQCGGHVKPDVVLFGELLPAEAMAEAESLAGRADLMLCVGSSLEVYPVAGLPSVTMRRGGRIAVITMGPTPFDADAEVRMDGDVVRPDLEAVAAGPSRRSPESVADSFFGDLGATVISWPSQLPKTEQSKPAVATTTARNAWRRTSSWLLTQAHFDLVSEISAAFEPIGVSNRGYHVLTTALGAEHTQKELAELIGLDKTTMVVTVDELEKAGLAERRPSSTDRRARVISVTKAGERTVRRGREDRRPDPERRPRPPCPRRSARSSSSPSGAWSRTGSPSRCRLPPPLRRREPGH